MSKILYINNNDFHNLGRSQMCAGACYVFRTSKPHSGTLWIEINIFKAQVMAKVERGVEEVVVVEGVAPSPARGVAK